MYPPGRVTTVSEGGVMRISTSFGFSAIMSCTALFAIAGLAAALIVFVMLFLC